MGRVILCLGNRAQRPYFLKKAGISVYTVEELCYCIKEHTFLMDEDVVCQELADWLHRECGLADLADRLRGLLKKKASDSEFLMAVLEYTGYYPKKETERIRQFLRAGAGLGEYERRKNMADYLADSGRYERAMEQYHWLLHDIPKEDRAFRARLCRNMGCVSSRLFLFEQAASYFYEAWNLSDERENFLQFLAAKRLYMDEKEYVDFITEEYKESYDTSMELEKRIEQSLERWKECDRAKELERLRLEGEEHPEDYTDVLEDIAEQMKEKYRSMVKEK